MLRPPSFVRSFDIPNVRDDRGVLRVLDELDIPFQCRRIYWLSEVPRGQSRGNHGHRNLKQVFIALSGSFTIRVWKEGFSEVRYSLSQEGPALYVEAGCWRELSDFSDGAVALVLASEAYDPGDYLLPQNDNVP